MLTLRIKSGEYITIGDDIAVQVFKQAGDSLQIAIKAPKEVPILRGEVLERTGNRPEGLREKRYKAPSERRRDAKRLEEMHK